MTLRALTTTYFQERTETASQICVEHCVFTPFILAVIRFGESGGMLAWLSRDLLSSQEQWPLPGVFR